MVSKEQKSYISGFTRGGPLQRSPETGTLNTAEDQKLKRRCKTGGSNGSAPRSTKMREMLWQNSPPRLVRYRPEHLHYYGWAPLFVFRNLTATIFCDPYLYIQTLVLLAWVALLHNTGLWVPFNDLSAFVMVFGMNYGNSVFFVGLFNLFILGLLTTRIVSRWCAIKDAYGRLLTSTVEVCLAVASTVRMDAKWGPCETSRVRMELTRLLNLGHVLVIAHADAQGAGFTKRCSGLKSCAKWVLYNLRVVAGFLRRTTGIPVRAGSGAVEGDWGLWAEKIRFLEYEDLATQGLVNADEWRMIRSAEEEGLPGYQTVYHWVQALLRRCEAADSILSAPQMLPVMLSKVGSLADQASEILHGINTQHPYPHVHLVSFFVHAYLIILSTWYGGFLHVGFPSLETFKVQVPGAQEPSTTIERQRELVAHNMWTVTFVYLIVAFAASIIQGFLNLHGLLDNPFGNHSSAFPLKSHTAETLDASRALLLHADFMPEALCNIFRDDSESKVSPSGCCSVSSPLSSEFQHYLNPLAFNIDKEDREDTDPPIFWTLPSTVRSFGGWYGAWDSNSLEIIKSRHCLSMTELENTLFYHTDSPTSTKQGVLSPGKDISVGANLQQGGSDSTEGSQYGTCNSMSNGGDHDIFSKSFQSQSKTSIAVHIQTRHLSGPEVSRHTTKLFQKLR